MAEKKRCPKCGETKLAEDFSCRTKSKWLSCWCKQCSVVNSRKWRKANLLKSREISRNQHYRKHFGITLTDYDRMFENQKGVCAICNKEETDMINDKKKRLSVDHNHETGKIRGLLCKRCNGFVVGLIETNKGLIEKAFKYLDKYNGI